MTREELIALKENRGYSVAKLSEYSGVPEGTIRKIITGESKHPRTATLNALKKVLFGDQSVYSGKTYKYAEQSAFFTNEVCEEETSYIIGSSIPTDNGDENHSSGAIHKKQGEYTIEDYLNLPEGERKELIDGVFYDMATPLNVHQEIIGYMYFEIKSYIKNNKGKCRVVISPSSVQLDCDDKTMIEPDIYIVCDKNKIRRFGNYGAPDFVLEVLSESTRSKDMRIKTGKYFNAGVKEIWYIDLKTNVLITYFKDDDYMPVIHPLEGSAGVSIYEGKLQINLSDIADIIEEYSNIPE
ncbi:MAG: Uma2 family endonuclease [Lachnospiraceae bacterium]|nr:Uma2 family endonuclease [Lachnospiraceae bacterium]